MLIPVCIMCVLIEVLEVFLPNYFTVIFSCNKFHMNFNIVNAEWGQKRRKKIQEHVILFCCFIVCVCWLFGLCMPVSVHTRSQQRDGRIITGNNMHTRTHTH